MQGNVRNQMYLVSEAIRLMPKYGPKMSALRGSSPLPAAALLSASLYWLFSRFVH